MNVRLYEGVVVIVGQPDEGREVVGDVVELRYTMYVRGLICLKDQRVHDLSSLGIVHERSGGNVWS